jgi:hypothetical protein
MYPIFNKLTYIFIQQPIYYTLYLNSRIFYFFLLVSPWAYK